ncbi:DNA recombination protein RmuC [Patescibacteria group bacterium]
MNQDLYLISAILIAGFSLLGWFVNRKIQSISSQDIEEEKTKNIVNQVFGEVSSRVIDQAKSVLETDKEAIYKDNIHKKDVIEKIVTDLQKELKIRQEEIRELERDRNKKFADISRSIAEHKEITRELKTSTESLSRVLSNNQTRGEWGERIIETILTDSGLIEDVHYQKQKSLPGTKVIPDITLLLPNERKVAIDVKFPYQQIQHMAKAETKSAKKEHQKLFEKDLKTKITQIEKRGYIDIEAGTLDYAIMFVPNEMLFSYINQQFPHIVDQAMAKKIILTSPFTFLVVARTVMESYKNFMIENNLRGIIKHIHQFIEEWERFTGEFNKFDESIAKLRDNFDKIKSTRYKRMQLRIRRIQEDEGKSMAKKESAVIAEKNE